MALGRYSPGFAPPYSYRQEHFPKGHDIQITWFAIEIASGIRICGKLPEKALTKTSAPHIPDIICSFPFKNRMEMIDIFWKKTVD